MTAVVREILDWRGSSLANIEADNRFAKQAAKVVSDEAVAATDVEHVGPRRQHARHFQRHIVRAPHLAAASHALEATFDRGEYSGHDTCCSNASASMFVWKIRPAAEARARNSRHVTACGRMHS